MVLEFGRFVFTGLGAGGVFAVFGKTEGGVGVDVFRFGLKGRSHLGVGRFIWSLWFGFSNGRLGRSRFRFWSRAHGIRFSTWLLFSNVRRVATAFV